MRFQCVSPPLTLSREVSQHAYNLRIGARELWIFIFFLVSPSNLMFFLSEHLKSFFCCKLHHLFSFCALSLSEWCWRFCVRVCVGIHLHHYYRRHHHHSLTQSLKNYYHYYCYYCYYHRFESGMNALLT